MTLVLLIANLELPALLRSGWTISTSLTNIVNRNYGYKYSSLYH